MPAALLFAPDAAGALHIVAAVGSWGGEASTIRTLAERLRGGGVDVLDAADAIEGARFAAGARLGDGEGALLVLDTEDRTPDADWTEAFATTHLLALGLVRSLPDAVDLGSLLHEVTVHPGSFEDRLGLALQRATEMLGLDGAAFAQIADGEWRPHTVFDPSGHLLPLQPVPLDQTCCAVTVQTDGPFAVADARAGSGAADSVGAYIGAPVFVRGRCVGTFCAVGHHARRRPFSAESRALVESLARWVGASVQGTTTDRLLADREADLAGFFDGAPMGMGLTRLLDGDLEFIRINAMAAASLGAAPDAIAGRRASEVGLGGRVGRQWLSACRRALTEERPQQFTIAASSDQGERALSTTVSLVGHDAGEPPRFAFIVEDVTGRSAHAHNRSALLDDVLAQAPLAVFATDADLGLVWSGGQDLDLLDLDATVGTLVADAFQDVPTARACLDDALAWQPATWVVERGDRTFEVRVQGRADDEGAPCGVVGVALDITGHAGTHSAQAEARRELIKHLDHEIRSPLTSILGYADLLAEDPTPDDLAEVRGVIERAGDRLMAALDELTLFGGDAVSTTPVPTDACAVLAVAAEASRAAADARRLSFNLWCTLPPTLLLLDAPLFERLVRYLISDAVATAQGSRVDVQLRAEDASTIALTVTGGARTGTSALREAYVPRLAEALGGTARPVGGDASGWMLRLPRHAAPMLDLPMAWADGSTGDIPTMAL